MYYHLNKEETNHFSIILTSKCNLNCSYCHFFSKHDRANALDLPENLLDDYLNFIKYFNKHTISKNSVRFSGGDPIILGDKLFEIADKTYKITNLKPFILTGGKGINKDWINKARKSHLTHAYISIENPLNPDIGAMNPYQILDLINTYSSDEFKLLPGVTVVRNEDFKDIFKISNIIYDAIGYLPCIQEINYLPYKSPTDQELADLYENLYMVVKKYSPNNPINMFSYISPEFSSVNNQKPSYLYELNLDNTHSIGKTSMDVAFKKILKFRELNYPKLNCKVTDCDWHDICQNIKWLWKLSNANVTSEEKLKDYCRFKKTINSAFYDALINQ